MAHAQPDGFSPLLNDNNLEGWWGLKTVDPATLEKLSPSELASRKAESLKDVHAHWTIKDGLLENDGSGLFLTTDQWYGDFELQLDYNMEAGGDSGIYLRGMPQVQIWDHTNEAAFKHGAQKGSGGLWNNKKTSDGKDPLVLADNPAGTWNHLHILMVGERVTVTLNGKVVVDHARLENYFGRRKPGLTPIPKTGPIQLQTHGKPIQWKNIFIREIPSDEANRILNEKSFSGGENPSDWLGATENHIISDNTIQCKKGKAGTLFTQKVYTNFVARFEFLLPKGGNNGLALRYPGQGNPAYSGMCELQVLDNDAPNYSELDARQYHGSAYGMVAAQRGFLRPTGEWNQQTVTVMGSTIVTELNGTVILNTDLSKVSDYLGNKKHTGQSIPAGHFGFAGHNSPVTFRNLTIKEL